MKKNWKNRSETYEVRGTRYKVRSTRFSYILVLVFLLFACGNDQEASHDTYTCPMHPTVLANKPGACPVCGMNLVRKARPGETVVKEDMTSLVTSPNETVVSSVKTIRGEFTSKSLSVKAQGIVTYDSRFVYTISSRMTGRLERVYLTYNFQQVRKGQKIAEVYSPELITAQRELLFLLEQDTENQSLIEASKQKLNLLGATQQQIDEVVKRKEVSNTFSLYSPYDGYLITNDQQTPVTTTPGQGMSNLVMGSTQPAVNVEASPDELIREGNYVSAGQTLVKIVNTTAVRIELDLPASIGQAVKPNDEVDLVLNAGKKEKAVVDFVQPFFTQGQEFVKVRVVVRGNTTRIGELVEATIQLGAKEGLWLPREAVLDLGLDKIVFIKEHGAFQSRKVVTGIQTDGWVSIEQGLSSSEEVASHASYLVDSESFIKSK